MNLHARSSAQREKREKRERERRKGGVALALLLQRGGCHCGTQERLILGLLPGLEDTLLKSLPVIPCTGGGCMGEGGELGTHIVSVTPNLLLQGCQRLT
jgi:hypothetical protein